MRFSRHQDILIAPFDGELLVFDLKTHLPYALNGVAADILMSTDGRRNPENIAGKICEKYDVEFHEALKDIHGLYEELILKGIVERVKEK